MRRNQIGSLLIEAIIMLGLISVLTPILYKHVADRRADIEDVNKANTMLSIRDEADKYIREHYEALATNGNGFIGALSPSDLGLDESLDSSYSIGFNKDGEIISAMVVCTDGRQDDLRAAKVASLIGISAGIYSSMDTANAYGINGIWSDDPKMYFGNTPSIITGTPVVTTKYNKEDDVDVDNIIAHLMDKDVTVNSLTTNQLCLGTDEAQECITSVQSLVDIMTAGNMFASKTLKVKNLVAETGTYSGNITSSATIQGKNVKGTTSIEGGTIKGTTGTFTGNVTTPNLTATGIVQGKNVKGTTSVEGGTISGTTGTFTGNVTTPNLTATGTVQAPTVKGTTALQGGTISGTTGTFSSNVTVTGNMTSGNVYANSGMIQGKNVKGTTSVQGGTISGSTGTFTGNVTTPNITVSGTVQGGAIKGSTGTFTGDVTTPNLTATGIVQGATVKGTTAVQGGTISGTTGTFTGNVTTPNLTATGTVQGATVKGTTAVQGGTISGTTGNFSGNITSVGDIASSSGNIRANKDVLAGNKVAGPRIESSTETCIGGECKPEWPSTGAVVLGMAVELCNTGISTFCEDAWTNNLNRSCQQIYNTYINAKKTPTTGYYRLSSNGNATKTPCVFNGTHINRAVDAINQCENQTEAACTYAWTHSLNHNCTTIGNNLGTAATTGFFRLSPNYTAVKSPCVFEGGVAGTNAQIVAFCNAGWDAGCHFAWNLGLNHNCANIISTAGVGTGFFRLSHAFTAGLTPCMNVNGAFSTNCYHAHLQCNSGLTAACAVNFNHHSVAQWTGNNATSCYNVSFGCSTSLGTGTYRIATNGSGGYTEQWCTKCGHTPYSGTNCCGHTPYVSWACCGHTPVASGVCCSHSVITSGICYSNLCSATSYTALSAPWNTNIVAPCSGRYSITVAAGQGGQGCYRHTYFGGSCSYKAGGLGGYVTINMILKYGTVLYYTCSLPGSASDASYGGAGGTGCILNIDGAHAVIVGGGGGNGYSHAWSPSHDRDGVGGSGGGYRGGASVKYRRGFFFYYSTAGTSSGITCGGTAFGGGAGSTGSAGTGMVCSPFNSFVSAAGTAGGPFISISYIKP